MQSETIVVDTNITLRYPKSSDTAALYAVIEQNRPYLRHYLAWVDETKSSEDTRQFIETTAIGRAKGDNHEYLIWFQDEIAGFIAFNTIHHHIRLAILGYWLTEKFTGHGIMTKAARALVAHGFSTLGLHRIESRCALSNSKSQQVLERVGFQREGLVREAIYEDGNLVDAYQYGCLAEDLK